MWGYSLAKVGLETIIKNDMFNNVSMAGSGLAGVLVWLIVFVGKTYLGIDILEADAIKVVTDLLGVVGIILAYAGQYRRKDLVGGVFRK